MGADDISVRADSISLRRLRLFECVGRLNSIRRASEECNLSQPAVTQSIANLESQIGVSLLHRRTSGSYLTELGTILHQRTSRFFAQIEKATAELAGPGKISAAPIIARRLTRSQIRTCIVLVTDRISFAEAAKSYGLSAASLQRTLHDLERNVEKQLFSRSASGITSTPEGIAFGRKIKLAVLEVELGLSEIDAAQGKSQTQIVVNAMPGGGSVLLGSVLDEFLASFPQACVRVVSSNAPKTMTNLLFGDVDIVMGLIPETLHDELHAQPLVSSPYEIVGRRGHPMLRKGTVTIDDLAACDWIVGTPPSSRRAAFNLLFEGHAAPRKSVETCSMPVIRGLLSASERLTLMTSYERIYFGEMLVPIPFSPPGPVPAAGLVMRRSWLPTSLHESFIQLLQRRVAGAHPPRVVARTG